ncbi:MAG: tetratricopeptide repeat protein [Bacteroidota bacterium]
MLIKYSHIVFASLLIITGGVAQAQPGWQLADEYYKMGEVDKAKSIYDKLARKPNNIPAIHENYFTILLDLDDYNEASKYIDRAIKYYPQNNNYRIDKGLILIRSGKETEADKYFYALIDVLSNDRYQIRRSVQYLLSHQLYEYSILGLETARMKLKDPYLFSIDLANIYRVLNNKPKMIKEYLNFAIQNPRSLRYVKNSFQVILIEPGDMENLERMLFTLVQENPDNEIYGEMLIWVNLQQKNFYEAFIQARAVDKRLQMGGVKILNVGVIALNNKDYSSAIRIFDYIAENYSNSGTGIQAQLYRINARENLVKTSYPVSREEVNKLVNEYNSFIAQYPNNYSANQAQLNKAKLFAYYLDNNDSAIYLIEELVQSPRVNRNLVAQAKLDLADVYLLNEEPWESALLYSQVDKTMKETPLGYEAKLRNAKLAYYRGNFRLAQEYLDILKLATSREIANDALDLSIFIQSNTALDTSTTALKQYADIELTLYQHKTEQALAEIDEFLVMLPNHELVDDLLFLKADIHKKLGEFTQSADLLSRIVNEYGNGLLGAKAYYDLGLLYEDHILDKEKAQEIYNDFLVKYPGSIYTSEVRKRFRALRENNQGSDIDS